MKGKFNTKIALIIGLSMIVIAILIGIIFEHDIGFVIAGIGTIITGFAILSLINKGE